jgi:hypothetical protein
MENITRIGIDLAKTNSHLVGVNHQGRVVFKKKVHSSKLVSEITLLGNHFKISMESLKKKSWRHPSFVSLLHN